MDVRVATRHACEENPDGHKPDFANHENNQGGVERKPEILEAVLLALERAKPDHDLRGEGNAEEMLNDRLTGTDPFRRRSVGLYANPNGVQKHHNHGEEEKGVAFREGCEATMIFVHVSDVVVTAVHPSVQLSPPLLILGEDHPLGAACLDEPRQLVGLSLDPAPNAIRAHTPNFARVPSLWVKLDHVMEEQLHGRVIHLPSL
mmetsp:Transcript_29049/g.69178  ORF Transcript_29049/g.69178 Transcript_29049/m.69178 type:complete len:203 (+) Transcript_29049:1448-2056(+)